MTKPTPPSPTDSKPTHPGDVRPTMSDAPDCGVGGLPLSLGAFIATADSDQNGKF